ncbi:MAG: flagellar motor protein MotB [Candidatus Marinimicrobia bacterium]|jgi:chemotaxis protein MotB|nr:flagellar motor protein MotB [Candidatus Neomarinimicrobiota bacterium]
MKKIKLKKVNKDVVDGWMGTYGDMITLLMAFFVLLFAVSYPDPGKYEEIRESMQEAFSNKEIQNEFSELNKDLIEVFKNKGLEDVVEIIPGPKGILVQIPGSTLFSPASADINSDMTPVIEAISTTITDLLNESTYQNYMIEVEGHTDDIPIVDDSEKFSSNWDLSAIRATGIVEVLQKSGIEMHKLKPIARAESIPLFPNRNDAGFPIPENMAKNRRVEIYINKF